MAGIVLSGCLANIAQQSHAMKNCLAENNLLQALKHCSNFLSELRTNQLSPKQYYEMYIVVFDLLEQLLQHLQQLYVDKKRKNADTSFLSDLYELVQYSGNIIPRLYMMVAIGTTYMTTENSPKKEIMKDMIEMCRGVQHPIRGLFLRYYLSQRIRNLLPLDSRDDFDETVDFLVLNFIEMNKLWVRLQHQGHSLEREQRYRERKELKILVGSNLVRLSQVIDEYDDEGYLSIDYYKSRIFPIITEQIIQCRDHLAQSYLIDVLIQIFPDDFHFATLDILLDVFLNLHPLLKKSELVANLIERFIDFKEREEVPSTQVPTAKEIPGINEEDKEIKDNKEDKLEGEKEVKVDDTETNTSPVEPTALEQVNRYNSLFPSFWKYYLNIPELPYEEHSVILQSFIKLTLTYDTSIENLDMIYKFATEKLQQPDNNEDSLWLELLLAPIGHLPSIKSLFKLSSYHDLYLRVPNPIPISLAIIEKLISEDQKLTSHEEIDGIFKYLLVLIKDKKQSNTATNLGITPTIKTSNPDVLITQDFLDNQEKICKVVQLVETKDPFKNVANLMYLRRKYLNKSLENIVYTYPALISKILSKLRIIGLYVAEIKKKRGASHSHDLLITSNFKNLSLIIDELYANHQEHHSELILKVYLDAAAVADQLHQQLLSYELFNQCFVVYEENLMMSLVKQVYNAHDSVSGGSIAYISILAIANRLYTLRNFNKDNFENLITKLTLYGSKLLKKQDQCRAVYFCAHLWYWCEYIPEEGEKDETTRDFKRVLECLQKALRVADSCMDPYLSLKLFIEILNRCLVFNIADLDGQPVIDARYINGLIELIKTNVENLQEEGEDDKEDTERKLFGESRLYFERTLKYIKEEQDGEDLFEGVSI